MNNIPLLERLLPAGEMLLPWPASTDIYHHHPPKNIPSLPLINPSSPPPSPSPADSLGSLGVFTTRQNASSCRQLTCTKPLQKCWRNTRKRNKTKIKHKNKFRIEPFIELYSYAWSRIFFKCILFLSFLFCISYYNAAPKRLKITFN